MQDIDFWFSIGSTYSYLAVMRLGEVERQSGARFHWRPFNVREMMIRQKNIPFADKPAKAAYMWRDIARRAAKYGLPARIPAPYPIDNLALANQVALVGMQEGWGRDYVVETYKRWFQEGQKAGSEPNLSDSLRAVGQEPARAIELAQGAQAVAGLKANTESAEALGLFGVPSFVVGGELFWGDDRLEDALSWAREGRVV